MGTARTETGCEPRIDEFLGKYTPATEAQLRDARGRLRALFPRGFELIFDNYNALVFAISARDSTREAFVSVAGYPKWVTLFFLHGTDLDDPHELLEGNAKQVRSIRLKSAADINRPEIQALIAQAGAPLQQAFEAAPPLTSIIKSVVAKQRPRRPA